MSVAGERKRISDQHEQAVIQAFAEYLREKGNQVIVLDRSEEASQGDGLLLVGNQHRWLEIISIYQNDEEAKELWQSVTPGESPPPHPLDISKSLIPRKFHERLIEGVIKKLEKGQKPNSGYLTSKNQWGPGVLIADCRDPLIDLDCPMEQMFVLDELNSKYDSILSLNESEIFKEVFLYVPINWSNQRKFIPFLEDFFRLKSFADFYDQSQRGESLSERGDEL